MNRRDFLAAMAATSTYPGFARAAGQSEQPCADSAFVKIWEAGSAPASNDSYIEKQPVPEFHRASASAYEAFQDTKFGVRIHWGIYCIWHRGAESWPFLNMTFEDRQRYNDLYKTWNPSGFDAEAWIDTFKQSGMQMFTFTTKHHEGFSMFDTRTRVKSRTNWTAAGGPKIEECDLAYSIMATPFGRDVVKELCDAAHQQGNMKINLYFSHPDWYDADFRPYGRHPLQVPSSAQLITQSDWLKTVAKYRDHPTIVPDPSDAEVTRMMERHRGQLLELLTNYGKVDMIDLDIHLGWRVWPELRKTLIKMRQVQPDVLMRSRGIDSYGDYSTPERVIPGSNQALHNLWFCIYPLGTDFSYEPDASKYKGTQWIVHTLADTVAKGGGLEIGVGPDAHGEFHPEAIRQMRAVGPWLRVNGEAIYATRPRAGDLWSEGDAVRYTRSKDERFVYAILMDWPGTQVTLKNVRPTPGSEVQMMGVRESLNWSFDSAMGTTIHLPEKIQQASNRPCEFAWSLKFEALRA